jgi:alpha-methylacyl-CoA racemase
LRVIEIASLGPGPFCAMMLADMGADVLRIDRAPVGKPRRDPRIDLLNRGRRSVAFDLKRPAAVEAVLRLVERADALIEGFRPGTMERLGLGPEQCLARNKRLVYGRMTGWGQTGPLASAAGHDINYIALSGALEAIGPRGGGPVVPLNLVGDFGGGGMVLAFGVVCAVLEARQSGSGQVVDAAMVDGAASLMTMFYGLRAAGQWKDQRGSNMLDGGAPYYGTYETADGRHIAIGPIESQFYDELLSRLGLAHADLPPREDQATWPTLREKLTALFKTRSRDEWCRILEGSDACFAPVLSMAEAPHHAHNKARGTFVEVDGIVQPGAAPRFSRTPGAIRRPPPRPGEHSAEALADWGFTADEIATLRGSGALHDAKAP